MKQLRQREAEERRAARAAREQGEIDVNQIPLGEKVHIENSAKAGRSPSAMACRCMFTAHMSSMLAASLDPAGGASPITVRLHGTFALAS